MKVLLLGNTCNNNFAFMRHLSDLDIDTTLCLYSDEGLQDSNPIHSPSWDHPFGELLFRNRIFRLEWPNSPKTIIYVIFYTFFNRSKIRKLKRLLAGYDIVIGSGISPSLYFLLGLRLDIFYPYSTGIEWLEEVENLRKIKNRNFASLFYMLIFYTQLMGIKASRRVINSSPGSNKKVMDRHNIKYITMMVPQYYKDIGLVVNPPPSSEAIVAAVRQDQLNKNSVFSIFSFMRHLWVFNVNKHDKGTWNTHNKRNDILIIAFAKFITQNNISDAILYLSDWGPDVSSSKELIAQVGVDSYIRWLPLMPRHTITYLLANYADIGIGEFVLEDGELWGSTGHECIALGIPYLETVNFTDQSFMSAYAVPLPYIFNCTTSDDVCNALDYIYRNREVVKSKAALNSRWHNEYAGHMLTRRWLTLFTSIIDEKLQK